ncbi:hypothetical protein ACJJTC_019387 [Scirpophaga incertulas]
MDRVSKTAARERRGGGQRAVHSSRACRAICPLVREQVCVARPSPAAAAAAAPPPAKFETEALKVGPSARLNQRSATARRVRTTTLEIPIVAPRCTHIGHQFLPPPRYCGLRAEARDPRETRPGVDVKNFHNHPQIDASVTSDTIRCHPKRTTPSPAVPVGGAWITPLRKQAGETSLTSPNRQVYPLIEPQVRQDHYGPPAATADTRSSENGKSPADGENAVGVTSKPRRRRISDTNSHTNLRRQPLQPKPRAPQAAPAKLRPATPSRERARARKRAPQAAPAKLRPATPRANVQPRKRAPQAAPAKLRPATPRANEQPRKRAPQAGAREAASRDASRERATARGAPRRQRPRSCVPRPPRGERATASAADVMALLGRTAAADANIRKP